MHANISFPRRASLAALALICAILISQASSQDSITVDAGDLGQVRGFKFYTNRITKSYYAFGGIPYGSDATGTNRFKAVDVRTGPLTEDGSVFDANRWDRICPQDGLLAAADSKLTGEQAQLRALLDHPSSLLNRSIFGIPEDSADNSARSIGSENCLHLHINTPKIPQNSSNPDELLPVIVYVHGGSFMSFWSSLFNGGRLLNHDVLLVPINYRLGVLGFYNLGIDDAPGNAGIYDLITALQWIQKYIAYFGGDPNRVTITGQSAGAAAVTNIMASQLATGLFHNVIACSGTATQEWAITDQDNAIKNSLIISSRVGCYTPDTMPEPLTAEQKQNVTKCMQGVAESELVATLSAFREEDRKNKGLGFHAGCPSVQDSPDFSNTMVKVVPEDPFTVFEEGRQLPNINLMIGATRHDGSFVLQEAYDDFIIPNNLQNNASYIRTQLLSDMLTILGMEDKTYGVVQSLADTFIGDAKYSDELRPLFPGLIDIFGVFFYKALAYRTAEFNARSASSPRTYLFSFDQKGPWSLHAITNIGSPIKGGVSHVSMNMNAFSEFVDEPNEQIQGILTDDQIYLFQWFPFFNKRDQDVSTRWVTNWVNFATYGNPNGPDSGDPYFDLWPQFPRYLQIGKYNDYEIGDSVREFYRDDWKGVAYDVYPIETTTTTASTPTPTTTTATPPTTTPSATTPSSTTPGTSRASISFESMASVLILLVACIEASLFS